MTPKDALQILQDLARKVTGKDVTLTLETDLKKDGILDSVDALVFFMELDTAAGLSVPETADLVAEGYYSVAKLARLLTENS